jgi:hypothetical protein
VEGSPLAAGSPVQLCVNSQMRAQYSKFWRENETAILITLTNLTANVLSDIRVTFNSLPAQTVRINTILSLDCAPSFFLFSHSCVPVHLQQYL